MFFIKPFLALYSVYKFYGRMDLYSISLKSILVDIYKNELQYYSYSTYNHETVIVCAAIKQPENIIKLISSTL